MRRTVRLPNWQGGGGPPVFSADGKMISVYASFFNMVYLIHTEGDERVTTITRPHTRTVDTVAFTPDGKRLLSTGTAPLPPGPDGEPRWKNEVFLWDVRDGQKVGEWPLPDSAPAGCGLAFTSRGEQMLTVHNDRILVWDFAKQSILRTIDGLTIRNPTKARVSVDPLDRIVAVDDYSSYVWLWDLASGKPLLTTGKHHQGDLLSAAWSADGKQIATGDSRGEVWLWNAESGQRSGRFNGQKSRVWNLAYLAGGSQLLLCGDEPEGNGSGSLRWHETSSGKLQRELRSPGRIRRFAVSPDGKQIAVAGTFTSAAPAGPFASPPGSIALLESDSGRLLRALRGHKGRNIALCWSPGGKELVSVNEDTTLERHNVATGHVTAEWKLEHLGRDRAGKVEPGGLSHSVFLNSGAGVITAGSLQEIYGWGTTTGIKHWTIKTKARAIRSLALAPDQKMLACIASEGDDAGKTLLLYDSAAQRELTRYDLGRENCDRLVFSPDGSRILVAFLDGTALVYDVSAAWNKVE